MGLIVAVRLYGPAGRLAGRHRAWRWLPKEPKHRDPARPSSAAALSLRPRQFRASAALPA